MILCQIIVCGLAKFWILSHYLSMLKGKLDSGMLYIIVIMAAITTFAFYMVGGKFPKMFDPAGTPKNPGKQEIIFEQVPDPKKKNLQLQTFKVKNTCESKIAVDFLIDVSGSMGFNGGIKQTNEKNALKAFTDRMVDSSVVGIQTFSSGATDRVPLSYYKDVRSQVSATINGLTAGGATYTRDAFALTKQKLSSAISQDKFPGYKYFLIFITDGVPEADPPIFDDAHCEIIVPDSTLPGGKRCFAKIQDPRGTPTDSTNIGTEIKNAGVETYSLAITSQTSSDQQLLPYLTALMQNVASTPLTTHFYSSDNGSDLKTQLDSVFKDICT